MKKSSSIIYKIRFAGYETVTSLVDFEIDSSKKKIVFTHDSPDSSSKKNPQSLDRFTSTKKTRYYRLCARSLFIPLHFMERRSIGKHYRVDPRESRKIKRMQLIFFQFSLIYSSFFIRGEKWMKKKKEIKRKREIEGEWWMISSTGRCMVGRVDDQRSPSLKKKKRNRLIK